MSKDLSTHYFASEGRDHMQECILLAAQSCVSLGLPKLVIFSGTGEGPHYAAKEILSQHTYAQLQIVAVTPPYGRTYKTRPGDPESPVVRAGVNPAMRDELSSLGVSVVAAHLPFKEVRVGSAYTSEWAKVAEAYGVLGGGFALCIQAVLVACDAGFVMSGERVVVSSADTAIVAVASRTESFLSPIEGVLVEHIICRPMRYTVSRTSHRHIEDSWGGRTPEQPDLPLLEVSRHASPARLPEATDPSGPAPRRVGSAPRHKTKKAARRKA